MDNERDFGYDEQEHDFDEEDLEDPERDELDGDARALAPDPLEHPF